MNVNGIFSKESDEWYTPIDLFNELNEEFHFTLDPCGCSESHMTDKYYDINDDGLSKSWFNEIVFVNPPYSKIKEWSRKCFYESFSNNAKVVLLIPARTDTSYFHDYILPYAEIRFIRGRLKFSNCKNSAPFPSIICIFDIDNFLCQW